MSTRLKRATALDIGAVSAGLTARGAWNSSAVYAVNDLVTYGGQTWRANTANGPTTVSRAVLTGTASSRVAGATGSVVLPATLLVGDVILLALNHQGTDALQTAPAGFTFVNSTSPNGSNLLLIYRKIAVLADIGATVTWAGPSYSSHARTHVRTYTTPGYDANGVGGGAGVPASATATVVNDLQVTFYTEFSTDSSWADPSLSAGGSNVYVSTPGGSAYGRIVVAEFSISATGATSVSGGVFTSNAYQGARANVSVLLKPQAAPVLPIAYFDLWAAKGDTGATGAGGAAGATGATGATGPAGPGTLTASAGVPQVGGRRAGDRHYDTTALRDYVMTGAAGTSVADTFDRADSTGLGTSSSGVAWSSRGGSAANIVSNQVVSTSAGAQQYVPVAAGDVTLSARWKAASSGANAVDLVARLDASAGSTYQAHFVWTSGAYVSIGFVRTGSTLMADTATTVGYVAGRVYLVEFFVVGQVLTARITDTVTAGTSTISYTDSGSVLTGTNCGFTMDTGTSRLDDFSAAANGTLVWLLVRNTGSELYLSRNYI